MKRLLSFLAAAALSGAGLAGIGLLTHAASAAPCSPNTVTPTTINIPPVGPPQATGCVYLSVQGVNGTCTQAVAEDANPNAENNVGYLGVSNCDRDHDGPDNSPAGNGVVGVGNASGSGAACSDRWGTPGAGTNGGGCYYLNAQGTVIDLDVAELGELPIVGFVFDAVPLPVGGDTSGEYNATTRDGQGAETCDPADLADDFEDSVFTALFGGTGLVPNPTLYDAVPADGDPGVINVPEC